MEFNNIRLLVSNFDECFYFYRDILGLKVTWGEPGSEYASFDIGLPSGLALFKNELMAEAVRTKSLAQPKGVRDTFAVILKTEDVDTTADQLAAKGVEFINPPISMQGWGIRMAHFRDPAGNLIEIYSELSKDKWDKSLLKDEEKFGDKEI